MGLFDSKSYDLSNWPLGWLTIFLTELKQLTIISTELRYSFQNVSNQIWPPLVELYKAVLCDETVEEKQSSNKFVLKIYAVIKMWLLLKITFKTKSNFNRKL